MNQQLSLWMAFVSWLLAACTFSSTPLDQVCLNDNDCPNGSCIENRCAAKVQDLQPELEPSCSPECSQNEQCCPTEDGTLRCVALDDPEHCGSCEQRCPTGRSSCVDGLCVCDFGWASCGDDALCQSSTQSSPEHCGACDEACPNYEGHPSESCVIGQCTCLQDVCVPGWSCCPEHEGCTDLNTNPKSCGACGVECRLGEVCVDGVCRCGSGEACDPGFKCCGADGCQEACPCGEYICSEEALCCGGAEEKPHCAEVLVDPSNCGLCGNSCREDQVCAQGVCACAAGLTECDGACVDRRDDMKNCGQCGVNCEALAKNGKAVACVAGSCVIECETAWLDCTTHPGCETPRDSANCQDCGQACDAPTVCRLELDPPGCACPAGTRRCEGQCIASEQCCTDADCAISGSPVVPVCEAGQCNCPAGSRDCGAYCAPEGACCANSDCPTGQVCQSGSCVCPAGKVWCQNVQQCRDCCTSADCPGGKTCNIALGTCACTGGTIWCGNACVSCSYPRACVNGSCACDPSTRTCEDGSCAVYPSCCAGERRCGENCVTGNCCTNLDCLLKSGSICSYNNCQCPPGWADCGNRCVGNDKCCSDGNCVEGTCMLDGSCYCGPGQEYCSHFKNCQPVADCCWNADCGEGICGGPSIQAPDDHHNCYCPVGKHFCPYDKRCYNDPNQCASGT
ncbi:MAG: hypothetical protein RBU37_13180 [Myxococcota bacterium]|nr:hypothetical protein [Myxococcota bacterium]